MAAGNSLWILWAAVCWLCWGGGYVAITPLKPFRLNPFLLQTCNGLLLFLANFAALCISERDNSSGMFDHILSNPIVLVYISIYSLGGIIGSFFYLRAAAEPGVPTSLLTAFTSAYPLVTILFTFALFAEYAALDLRFAIPGMLCCIAGPVLLAFGIR